MMQSTEPKGVFAVLVNVKQAAEIIGCTTGRVRQLLLAGELPGQKITDTSWAMEKDDVERYAADNPRGAGTSGRPRISEALRMA